MIVELTNKTLLHLSDGSEHQNVVNSYINVRPGSRDQNNSFNNMGCGKEKGGEVVLEVISVKGSLSSLNERLS